MIVKCISKQAKDLAPDLQKQYHYDYEFHLAVGETFLVYAMFNYNGRCEYLIDNGSYYPDCYPAGLFEVVDPKISKYWIFNHKPGASRRDTWDTWAFPEWALDDGFYEAIVEDDEESICIYKRYKELMQLEYPNPGIAMKAQLLEDNWLMCPNCIDAWEAEAKDGMVVCPKCKQTMHNPLYKDIWVLANTNGE